MMPAVVPLEIDNGTSTQVAQATAKVTVPGCTQSRASGFSERSAATSRSRSATSLSQPAVIRPTSTVARTSPTSRRLRPETAAAIATPTEIDSDSNGCEASTSAIAVPGFLRSFIRAVSGTVRSLVRWSADPSRTAFDACPDEAQRDLSVKPHQASDLRKRFRSRYGRVLDLVSQEGEHHT